MSIIMGVLGTALCYVMAVGVVAGVIALYVLIEIEKYRDEKRMERKEAHP